jgi:MFS family permease
MVGAEPPPSAPPGGQRWRLAAVLGLTLLVGYYDRLNVSLALPLIATERGWTEAETAHWGGLLMSAFYVAYGLANILLSPLGARFGPRRSLLLMIVLWSVFTSLGALVGQFLALFIATRALLGLAEGIHFPMMNLLTQRWFPPHERSRANAIWISGLFLAVLTAPLMLVPVMHVFGWQSGFHLLAALGLAISLPLVWRHVHDDPASSPRLGKAEGEWLLLWREHEPQARITADHGLAMTLQRPAFLLMLAAGILNNMVALGLAGWFPTFLAQRLGVAYQDLSWMAALPYLASLAGLALFAVVGDWSGRRALAAAIGYLAGGLVVTAALLADTPKVVLALYALAAFLIASFNAFEFPMVQRILPPEQLAAGAGIYNGLSMMIGGGLGPFVVGAVISGSGSLDAVLPLTAATVAMAMVLAALARRIHY